MLLSSSSLVLATVSLVIFLGSPARAGDLSVPTGQVILEVGGEIEHTNSDDVARFDREILDSIGRSKLVTDTPWTEGDAAFEGVLCRDLLRFVGAKGSRIVAFALNDYSVEIPISDCENYDTLFAYYLNGEAMRVRNRGPIWVIFPWKQTPVLRNEVYYSRSIWQLNKLTVLD